MFKVLVVSVTLLIFAMVPAGAQAIEGDAVPDHEHPFVALVVLYDANAQFIGRCSGSLLTPHVVLTAGHCTSDYFFPVASARVYLQQNAMANPAQSGFPNSCAAGTLGVSCATSSQLFDYDYAPPWREFPDIRDVGLLILDQPLVLSEYGVLASAGYLDTLARRRGQQEHTFTISGYGLLKRGPTGAVASLERMMALSKLTSLTNHLTGGFGLQLVGNGNLYGGACRGDSGGPVFHGAFTSNVVVALSGYVLTADKVCTGNVLYYRTDHQPVIDWIMQTVPQSQRALIRFASP